MFNYQSLLETAFLEYLLNEGASKVTIKNYSSDLRHFLQWLTGSEVVASLEINESHKTILKKITPSIIKSYVQTLLAEKTPMATINRRLSTLRLFFRAAISLEWLYVNPMDSIHNLSKTYPYFLNRNTPLSPVASTQSFHSSLSTPTNTPPPQPTINTAYQASPQPNHTTTKPLKNISSNSNSDTWLLFLAIFAFVVSLGITGFLLTFNSDQNDLTQLLTTSISMASDTFGSVLGITKTSNEEGLISPIGQSDFQGKTATINLQSDNSNKSNSQNLSTNQIVSASGTSIIPAGEKQLLISYTKVVDKSLIYVTPTTTTHNQVIYIRYIYPGIGFVAAIDSAITTDIRFNWSIH